MAIEKWEYRFAMLHYEQDVVYYLVMPENGRGKTQLRPLNELGAQGWELAALHGSEGYFKRRVAPQEAGR